MMEELFQGKISEDWETYHDIEHRVRPWATPLVDSVLGSPAHASQKVMVADSNRPYGESLSTEQNSSQVVEQSIPLTDQVQVGPQVMSRERPLVQKCSGRDEYLKLITQGPTYVCSSCGGLWFEASVNAYEHKKLLDEAREVTQELLDTFCDCVPIYDVNRPKWICTTCSLFFDSLSPWLHIHHLPDYKTVLQTVSSSNHIVIL